MRRQEQKLGLRQCKSPQCKSVGLRRPCRLPARWLFQPAAAGRTQLLATPSICEFAQLQPVADSLSRKVKKKSSRRVFEFSNMALKKEPL